MNQLFPEDKVTIDFAITDTQVLSGNKIIYHIGLERGNIKKADTNIYLGYSFSSDNGKKYFLSKIKERFPNDSYDAVFYLDVPKGIKIDINIIKSCVKRKLYVKQPTTDEVTLSWDNAFFYKQERRGDNGIVFQKGLRPPQVGALHAVLSHWSISNKPALVVMPTGTGKTETMLCLSVANMCDKILVIVPSDSLRTQIADKFISFGILKYLENSIVSLKTLNPKVAILRTGFKDINDARSILDSNVIISTPQILSGLFKNGNSDIVNLFIEQCNYLIVDEAHHIAAKTWNQIKTKFEIANKRILMFTATPFRNDGARIDGDIIYNYPLSLAQKDNYYEKIIFESIVEYNPLLADQRIAEKAIEILKRDIDAGYNHILMARVDERKKAEEIYTTIYSKYSEFNPVFIHSGISNAEKKETLENIKISSIV